MMRARSVWVFGLGGILVADAWIVAHGGESLSETYARSLRKPVTGLPVVLGTTYLIGHLAGLTRRFEHLDPLHQIAQQLRKIAAKAEVSRSVGDDLRLLADSLDIATTDGLG